MINIQLGVLKIKNFTEFKGLQKGICTLPCKRKNIWKFRGEEKCSGKRALKIISK